MTFQETTKTKSIQKIITKILHFGLPPLLTITAGINFGLGYIDDGYCGAYINGTTNQLYNSTNIAKYGNTTATPDEVVIYGFVMENICKNFSGYDVKLAIAILAFIWSSMSFVYSRLMSMEKTELKLENATLSAQVSQQVSRAVSLQGFATNEPYYTEGMPPTVRSLDSDMTDITIASSTSTAYPNPVVYR